MLEVMQPYVRLPAYMKRRARDQGGIAIGGRAEAEVVIAMNAAGGDR
jgi:hypothetical protein